MSKARLEQIKEDLTELEGRSLYDTNDFSGALWETRQIALELLEVVERSTQLLERKRETIKLFGPAMEKAKEDRNWMLVAKLEIEKFKEQSEIDLLEYVMNGSEG